MESEQNIRKDYLRNPGGTGMVLGSTILTWTQGIALFPVESLKDPRFLSVKRAWEFQTPEFLELEMSDE